MDGGRSLLYWRLSDEPCNVVWHCVVCRAVAHIKHRWGMAAASDARGVLASEFCGLPTRALALRNLCVCVCGPIACPARRALCVVVACALRCHEEWRLVCRSSRSLSCRLSHGGALVCGRRTKTLGGSVLPANIDFSTAAVITAQAVMTDAPEARSAALFGHSLRFRLLGLVHAPAGPRFFSDWVRDGWCLVGLADGGCGEEVGVKGYGCFWFGVSVRGALPSSDEVPRVS